MEKDRSILGDILIGLFKIIWKIFLFLLWGMVRLLELICHSLATFIKNMLTPKER